MLNNNPCLKSDDKISTLIHNYLGIDKSLKISVEDYFSIVNCQKKFDTIKWKVLSRHCVNIILILKNVELNTCTCFVLTSCLRYQ